MSRNSFGEIVSGIFALFVFILVGGVLAQGFSEQANIIGPIFGLFGILVGIIFIAIIVKFIKSLWEDFL